MVACDAQQMLEVNRLDLDPELPGFDSREAVIGRYEEMIGRPLVDLDWYEIFAMVRMGCCILRTQVLLRHRPGRSLLDEGTDPACLDGGHDPSVAGLGAGST